jgi:DNA-binding LacI/PurR family transcriptional regulator
MQAGRQKTVRTPRGTCCSKTPRPTAVFVRTDVLAIGVLRTVRAMGLRVPEDISLVSHDDVPLAQFTDPPLTTVRVDYEALGKSAVEMLAAMLERKPIALSRTVHTTLIQRATVAPPLHHTLYHD